MERLKQRPSLSHLADKFNTAPPPGYVAGRGRGASGFSKADPADLPKGRGGGGKGSGGSAASDGAGSSSAAADDDAAAEHKLKLGTDGKLEGDAGDSRELDLSETERFEKQELSMDSKEAGGAMEAFNMEAERKEGHFDDDFNYVWKRKGEDPDDINDAWLGEVDSAGETAEKVEKRRRLLQRQIETQQQPDDAEVDRAALLRQMTAVIQPGETVAAALRRLSSSGGGKAAAAKAGVGKRKAAGDGAPPAPAPGASREQLLARQHFEDLTEAADALLRAGRFDVYSQKREALDEELSAARAAQGGAQSAADASAAATEEAAAAQAAALGIDALVHAGAAGGGFVLDPAHRVYYNATNGLYFDPRSSLYWPASGAGADQPTTYYVWDAAANQFVVAPSAEAQ